MEKDFVRLFFRAGSKGKERRTKAGRGRTGQGRVGANLQSTINLTPLQQIPPHNSPLPPFPNISIPCFNILRQIQPHKPQHYRFPFPSSSSSTTCYCCCTTTNITSGRILLHHFKTHIQLL